MATENEYMKGFFDYYPYKWFTYDDVLILPQKSDVVPSEVNLETRLTKRIILQAPLLSADMDTVTEHRMAIAMAMNGGMGFIHKNLTPEAQADEVAKVKNNLNGRIDKPITVRDNQTLSDVEEILAKYNNNFSTLVVLNSSNKVAGLVSRDQLKFSKKTDKVSTFMVKGPVMTEANLDVNQAYQEMKDKHVAKIILVNEKGGLKGLYCFKDVHEIVERTTPLYTRDNNGRLRVGANVGVGKDYEERAHKLLKENCDVLLIGVAHGHSQNVMNTIKDLKKNFSSYTFDIIAGNVVGGEGAEDLFDAGADGVKLGVGAGSICTTRIISGAGAPPITGIYSAFKVAQKYDGSLIADGGLRYSGDISKALAAGADTIMAGGLFAGTEESPGELVVKGEKRFKRYDGMASPRVLSESQFAGDRYKQEGLSRDKLVAEGVEGLVPITGTLGDIVYQLLGGARSGFGYVGARSIKELQTKGKFIEITSAGHIESHPHDVEIEKEPKNYKIR